MSIEFDVYISPSQLNPIYQNFADLSYREWLLINTKEKFSKFQEDKIKSEFNGTFFDVNKNAIVFPSEEELMMFYLRYS